MPYMPSTTVSPQPETYSPYLTDPDAAAEVKQNIADATPSSKERAQDLITTAGERGLHLFFARELRYASTPGGRS